MFLPPLVVLTTHIQLRGPSTAKWIALWAPSTRETILLLWPAGSHVGGADLCGIVIFKMYRNLLPPNRHVSPGAV